MDQIRHELRRFVTTNFLLSDEDDVLGDDASFMEQGIVDSTGVLELVSFLERRYAITLDDAELVPDNLDSIGKLTAFLERKLQAAA
jgi:acyl carrier protein